MNCDFRNASPANDNDNSSESDNSDGSSSGDSSSDENQQNESVTDWSLLSFVKPDVQPKPLAPIDPLPSLPVPEVKPEPDVKLSSTTRAGADSKKFLSPMCLNNEQTKPEPIGKCFVCQQPAASKCSSCRRRKKKSYPPSSHYQMGRNFFL